MKFGTAILLIVLAAGCFFGVKGCINASRSVSKLKDNYAIIQDSAKIYKDKYGIEHAQKELITDQMSRVTTYYGAQIDSMAQLLDIKPKRVKSIVYVPFEADINIDSLKQALASVDTVNIHSVDTVPGRVKINSIMSLTKYQKGTGFLGLKKKTYLDVSFDNPIFKPLNVSGFDITVKPKHWSIGPYVGYGWMGDKWAPNIGISIQYSLIKF